MKRGLIFVVLFILMFSIVIAQEEQGDGAELQDTTNGVTQQITQGLNERTENLLEKKVDLPSWLEMPARILFNIKDQMTWQQLIIVLGVWIGFFIIILGTLGIMPFLNKGIPKFLGALIITALVSITGALDYVATFFLDIAGFFKWVESHPTIRIVIAIIIAGIIVFAFTWIMKKSKKSLLLQKSEKIGERARTVDRINKIKLKAAAK